MARDSRRPPEWLSSLDDLDLHESQDLHEPRVPSLVAPRLLRALVAGSVATRSFDGALDVERIIRDLGRGEPLVRLPRRPNATLRRGVQLLRDVSEGMLPYRSDVEALVTTVRAVAGAKTRVFSFVGTPLQTEGGWRTPPPGTTVLLLTSLGIGGPSMSHERASVEEWLRFARRARSAGCPVVAWVPFEAPRWPPALARQMVLLPWSELLTPAHVRHRVGPGHRVTR